MIDLYKKQLEIEEEIIAGKKAKYIKSTMEAFRAGRAIDTSEGRLLFRLGYHRVRDSIQAYLDTHLIGHKKVTRDYLLLLSDDVDEITYILLSTIINYKLSSTTIKGDLGKPIRHISISSMAKHIINQLKKVNLFNRLRDNHPKLYSYLGREYRRASSSLKKEITEKKVRDLLAEELPEYLERQETKLGITLLKIVIDSGANIIKTQRRYNRGKNRLSFIDVALTADAIDAIMKCSLKMSEVVDPTFKPMVYKPKDWTAFSNGGFLSYKYNFIKIKDNIKWYKQQDYTKIFPAVNKLQSLEWRINKKIMDIISDIFEANMIDPTSPPTLPRLYGNLPTSNVITPEAIVGSWKKEYEHDKEKFLKWYKAKEACTINLAGETSRRLSLMSALSIAQEYCDYDSIYFPYQLDYRGRVYSIPSILSPQGPNYVKSMLEFSNGVKLTERGVYWLKIHTANTYGKDKESFEERIKWFDDNSSNIIEAAKEPLGHLSTWTTADSPFEFLAACMGYLDHIEGREVHVPIQLDATNSGLQFYSGVLGDKEGAELVNIVNKKEGGEVVRADVYQVVADEVNRWLKSDECPRVTTYIASDGVEKTISLEQSRKELIEHGVTRKMVKRNVMTIPYSVSLRGMSDQNYSVLDDIELVGKKFWTGDTWEINKLITTGVYENAYKLLQGAKIGQEYLKEVARLLDTVAVWYAPIYDFPIRQKAEDRKAKTIDTELGRLDIYLGERKLNRRRQKAGIAPNFIHSLDATVLIHILSNATYDVGVIHDCFLTNPNDGDKIREAYRNAFIDVMMLKPLEHFGRQLDPTGEVEVPYIGTLDLAAVAEAEYIIS